MKRMWTGLLLATAGAVVMSAGLAAQSTYPVMVPEGGVPEAAKPHLDAIREHLIKAEKGAGADFGTFLANLCLDASAGNDYLRNLTGREYMTGPDQGMDPIKVFDNLYYVGMQQNGSWALITSQGIILLDTLNYGETAPRLIPSIVKAGLNPADIKVVVIGHAHGDHMGGAKYLQQTYGAKVYMSKEDWDFAEAGDRGRGQIPKRDGVLADKQKVTLGDTTISAYFTPGHTPGAMSLILPVKDGNTVHYAAWWGGPQWGLRNTGVEPRVQMDNSMTYFRQAAAQDKADVFIETHPMFSGLLARMSMVKGRKPGQPHPMVVGTDGLDRYFTVWQECGLAALERYKVNEILYGADTRKWMPKVIAPVHTLPQYNAAGEETR